MYNLNYSITFLWLGNLDIETKGYRQKKWNPWDALHDVVH